MIDRSERFEKSVAAFESELKTFQKRIGIAVSDQTALRQAFTYKSILIEGPETHQKGLADFAQGNKALEREGNEILNSIIYHRTNGPGAPILRKILISNLLFSRIALNVGMDKFIRLAVGHSRVADPHSKVRTLANCFEAFIGALSHNPNGKEDVEVFLDKFFFGDLFIKNALPILASGETDAIRVLVDRLTNGIARLETKTVNNINTVEILEGLEVVGRGEGGVSEALYQAFLTYFKRNPWWIWGYEGSVSILYPQTKYQLRKFKG